MTEPTPPDQPEDAKVQEMSHTLLYHSWQSMKQRCYNVKSKQYPNYGGRGIRVADEWLHHFTAFRDYIGDRPGPEYSIDRIDNDGDYAPGNVRWATQSTQTFNQRIKDDNHVPGVELRKDGKRWQATIRVDGKYHYLGRYATKEEAVAARHAAELQYFNTTRTKSTVEPGTHNEITDEILSVIGAGAGGSYAAALRLTRWYEDKSSQAEQAARIDELKTQVLSKPTHISRQLEQQIDERIAELQATQPPAADTTKQGESDE